MKAAAVLERVALACASAALTVGCTAINLAPGALAGSEWRVLAINGRSMPAQGDYSIRFLDDGHFGAHFGCNHIGGRYRLSGDVLIFSNAATTLMGCPEPAGNFEAEGSAVISRPMRVSFDGRERMTLSNVGGSFSLERKD